MHLQNKLNNSGKKKILSLDGGGIRGIITIEILANIEKMLRKKMNDPDLILADYFDMIAGTSTGAIIASCISIGMSVDEIRKFYVDSGKDMFDRASYFTRLGALFGYKYNDEKLAQKLQNVFGKDTTLGSEKLKTLLIIVMHNAKTDSPWPVSNNPKAKYNDLEKNGKDSNLHLPLWQLIRASTAAPTYFPPEKIEVDSDNTFIFLDGGVTPFNNPAFQAYLMATLKSYNIGWKNGEDDILLVSIGTGSDSLDLPSLEIKNMHLLHNITAIPQHLMNASQFQQDMLCRAFGKCKYGHKLDSEIGDLIGKKGDGSVDKKLFTYLRYNIELNKEELKKLDLSKYDPDKIKTLDAVDQIDALQEVGQVIAKSEVKFEHFDGF